MLITRTAHAAAARVLQETRTAKAMLAAGARTTLRLKLLQGDAPLDRGGRWTRARAPGHVRSIAVRAADPADNARSATRRVRIVR